MTLCWQQHCQLFQAWVAAVVSMLFCLPSSRLILLKSWVFSVHYLSPSLVPVSYLYQGAASPRLSQDGLLFSSSLTPLVFSSYVFTFFALSYIIIITHPQETPLRFSSSYIFLASLWLALHSLIQYWLELLVSNEVRLLLYSCFLNLKLGLLTVRVADRHCVVCSVWWWGLLQPVQKVSLLS